MSQHPRVYCLKQLTGTAILATTLGSTAFSAEVDPQVSKALGYKPRQTTIAYDQVAEDDIENCTGKYETKSGVEGLTVYAQNGQVLRRFTDTNGDKKVDQWCYYKDGIEVYRDIDSDFNSVADQYRWLGTAGTRWGIDRNEDGKIDSWKFISAEEVTVELVEAIKSNDAERFRRLLLSDQEINQLGLGEEKTQQLKERIGAAQKGFAEFVKSQDLIQSNTKWAHFAADKPGVVPAGTDGSSADVIAYENVISIVDNDGSSQQLMVGTLVQLGSTWKLTDLPKTVGEGSMLAENGFFFPSATVAASGRNTAMPEGGSGLSGEVQTLLSDLEKTDSQLREPGTSPSKMTSLHDQRAQTLVKLINATKGTEEMELWVRQFVDSVASATMQDEYPEGLDRLRSFESQLSNLPGGKPLMPYVAYRVLNTDYQLKCMGENVNFAKLQGDHIDNLEAYVDSYSDSPDAADAMIQLALNNELTGNETEAKTWYQKVAKSFPATVEGKKASGAIARLSLTGRSFGLAGKTLDGKTIDTKQFTGTPMVVQYWASWSEPCKMDMKKIRDELARNPRAFNVVGINLDTERETAAKSLPPGLAPWAHIHEGNGFESELAMGLGVFTVPVTILIDGSGKVVKCGANFSQEMEEALYGMMESSSGARNAKLPVATPPQNNARVAPTGAGPGTAAPGARPPANTTPSRTPNTTQRPPQRGTR